MAHSPLSVLSPLEIRHMQPDPDMSPLRSQPRSQLDLSSRLIADAMKRRIEEIDYDECAAGAERAFFVADVGEVYRQHMRWKRNLPRVEPYYAIKCNPDPVVLRLLASLGTGFDCASRQEIQQVLALGVAPQRILYAHPCKAGSYIRYASSVNVENMTFDNPEELWKCKRFYPNAKLFLRILTDDSKALCQLSLKYGAPLHTTRPLLQLAKRLGLNVVGVSFHVGSGSYDPDAFWDAVQRARKVFDEALEEGYDLKTLDVGGGYGHHNFESIAKVLGPAIDENFPPSVRIIAEPGRYYVASSFTLATNVIARRTVDDHENISYMYYLNDGVYGSFNNILHDHQNPVAKVLHHSDRFHYADQPTGHVKCSLWGPTCDSIDCISSSCYLPCALEVGDWLYFGEMGAYTICAASKFNGFDPNMPVEYVCSEQGARSLLGW